MSEGFGHTCNNIRNMFCFVFLAEGKIFKFFFGDSKFEVEMGQWTCCTGAQKTG